MDGFPPANPGVPDEGSAPGADPLALARRLIDKARAEELEDVELGPLPVLPVPGSESPLELAMQLLYKASLEDDAKPRPDGAEAEEDPLALAMRLLGTVQPEEKEDTQDRLAIASQLLEVEEARRQAPDPLWTPDQSTPVRPDVTRWRLDSGAFPALPVLPNLPPEPPRTTEPEVELPGLPLQPDEPLSEWGSIPSLPLLEKGQAPSPGLELPEVTAPEPELPEVPVLAPPEPELPARLELPEVPVVAAPEPELPARLELPEVPVLAAPEPELPARLELPDVPVLAAPEPDLPARLELPEVPVVAAPEPDLPARLELPEAPPEPPALEAPEAPLRLELPQSNPEELARQLLGSEKKADPMELARRLLHDADREERADPLALARRLLKDVQRETRPAAHELMGAPVEENAPPPLFDPAGLGVEKDMLLGAPESAPAPELEPEAPGFEEVEFAEVESTHAPPANPPLLIPQATQVWPPPAEPTAPRLELERGEKPVLKSKAPARKPNSPVTTSGPLPALKLERDRPPERVAPAASPNDDRLELERAPGSSVESTRDGPSSPIPPPLVVASHTVAVPQGPPGSRGPRPTPMVPPPSAPVRSHRAAALAPLVRRGDALGTRLRKLFDRRARVEPNDVVIFTRQFSAMVSAGLQLHQALHFYAESHDESGMGPVVADVANRVSQGSTLSSAMRNYPNVFNDVYTGLIAAGETTGLLVAILSKLAELSERNLKLRQRVLAAITYPIVVLIVSLICVAVFIWVVLPMFVPMFTQLGVPLPWPTRVLVWVSQVGRNPYVVAAVVLLPPVLWLMLPLLRRFFGTPSRKRWWDRMILGLPYVGKLVEKVITARVLFSLASMLEAGIPFSNCLEKCEHVAGNAEIAHRLRLARALLVEGDSAADCLSAHHVFPSGAIQMIAVGEESAQLSEMILRVAAVYDDDVQLALLDLAAMLEPVILLVMGLLVGFIVLASAMPTAQLLQTL